MNPRRSVDPTAEPITSTEAKSYSRISGTDDDTDVGTLITAARQHLESWLDRTMVSSTWVYTLPHFPSSNRVANGDILLPFGTPLVSVSSITYVDENGTTQTLSAAKYVVDTAHEPGRISRAVGYEWPSTYEATNNAVTITYVSGYGVGATGVAVIPQDLKLANKMLVDHWYTNRGLIITGTIIGDIPETVKAILGKYQTNWDSYGLQ